MGVYLWTLFHSTVRVTPTPPPCCVDDCSFVGSFETRKRDTSTLFFLKYCFSFSGLLQFGMNLRLGFSISSKTAVGILTGTTLNL